MDYETFTSMEGGEEEEEEEEERRRVNCSFKIYCLFNCFLLATLNWSREDFC